MPRRRLARLAKPIRWNHRSLGGGPAGQFLAEFLRHVEDEGFPLTVLFKEPQVHEIQKICPRSFIRYLIGVLMLLDAIDDVRVL